MPARRATPVLMLLSMSIALAGCGVGEAKLAVEASAPDAPLPVEAVAVRVTDLYSSYHATSTLAADGEAQVPARIAGEVTEILVEEGDPVVQGQVLARLDCERLRLAATAAKAEYAQARNAFERQQKLKERGLVSRASFDSLHFDVAAREAAWRLEALNLSYAEIRAPISGVVAARAIKVGQHLDPWQLAFRISDTSRLVAELRVPQAELASIEPGQPIRLRVDAVEPTTFDAVVDRVSPTIDPDTGTFHLTSYIDNSGGQLAPGMFARLAVHYEKYENALALPQQAVVEEDGEYVVYLVVDGHAERRPVTLGARHRGLVRITAGVSPDDIAIRDAGGVRDGTRVAVADVGRSAGD